MEQWIFHLRAAGTTEASVPMTDTERAIFEMRLEASSALPGALANGGEATQRKNVNPILAFAKVRVTAGRRRRD